MIDLTVQNLNSIYESLCRENQKLLNDLKSSDCDSSKQREITRQTSLINTLMLNIIKYKNLKEKFSS